MISHKILRPVFVILMLMLGIPAAWAGDPVADQIIRLRAQREKAIADALAKANADYSRSLDKLKSLYASKPDSVAIIAREKEELEKISLVTVPPVVKITLPLTVTATAGTSKTRPSIQKPADLARYLIGTQWSYYSNDKFLGEPKTLEFTGPDTATIDSKDYTWKVTEKNKIWLSGDKEFTFNKQYNEFIGGWIPNPNDRNSARLIEP